MIRMVNKEDTQQICDIYNYYIQNTTISFEQEPVTIAAMEQRIDEIASVSLPWFVYEEDGSINGYAYASKWKGRCSYKYSVESTVYVRNTITGKGLGTTLYTQLLNELKNSDIHAVIAGIALPNEKSQKLHEKFHFKKVAHFSEIGFKYNQWIDVGYWQLLLK